MSAVAAAASEAEGDLIVRREGSAGILRLNRPKAINALTLDMTRGIAKTLDDFARDPKIAVVILEGAGERGLCAGGDIRGLYESSKAGGGFYTKTKTVTSRWPSGVKEGADFAIPTS